MSYIPAAFAVSTIFATLVGCAPPTNSGSYSGGTSATSYAPKIVQVEESQFEPTIRFVGIPQEFAPRSLNGTFSREWRLRSWLDKQSGKVKHQLYVTDIYNGKEWRFWVRANDQNASNLNFTSIDKTVISCSRYSGCGYAETFGVDIDDTSLRSAKDQQYCTKFYARNGESEVICLSTSQIAAQIQAIDPRRPTLQRPQQRRQTPAT